MRSSRADTPSLYEILPLFAHTRVWLLLLQTNKQCLLSGFQYARKMTDWKKTQETTFTKWVNSITGKDRVKELKTDLQDGIILADLLERVAKTRIKYVNEAKRLRIKPQQLENLGASFRFMQTEKIKLVNIGELIIDF